MRSHVADSRSAKGPSQEPAATRGPAQRAINIVDPATCKSGVPTQGLWNKLLMFWMKVFVIGPLKVTPILCLFYWLRKLFGDGLAKTLAETEIMQTLFSTWVSRHSMQTLDKLLRDKQRHKLDVKKLAFNLYTLSEALFFLYQKYRAWKFNKEPLYPPKIPLSEAPDFLAQERAIR
jgi:hypothetical protein